MNSFVESKVTGCSLSAADILIAERAGAEYYRPRPGQSFEDVEEGMRLRWQRLAINSRASWNSVREFARAAWLRIPARLAA